MTVEDMIKISEIVRHELTQQFGALETLADNYHKLNAAVGRAGFAVMRTSGDWSIHNISEHGKQADAKSLEVANANIELGFAIRKLRKLVERACDGWLPAESDIAEEAMQLLKTTATYRHADGTKRLEVALAEEVCNTDDAIFLEWSYKDVKSVRPDLSDEDAREVLHSVWQRHDAHIGVNWTVLETTADMMFTRPADVDEDDDA